MPTDPRPQWMVRRDVQRRLTETEQQLRQLEQTLEIIARDFDRSGFVGREPLRTKTQQAILDARSSVQRALAFYLALRGDMVGSVNLPGARQAAGVVDDK